jgi:hypothetical protein
MRSSLTGPSCAVITSRNGAGGTIFGYNYGRNVCGTSSKRRPSAPAIAWEPAKPVEIVVAAGAGGASDQMARMMQAATRKTI